MDKQQSLQTIVKYLKLNQPVKKSDCILVLGSHDIRVARRAVELFNDGLAPYVVFSGGIGRLSGDFPQFEGNTFADEAMRLGMRADKIIIENKSTNTGENIQFSMALLKSLEMNPTSFLVVTLPFLERRVFNTFKILAPDKEAMITSPILELEEYKHGNITDDDITLILLEEIDKIKEYPAKGFTIPEQIPQLVWEAFEQLSTLTASVKRSPSAEIFGIINK
jgi:uncharacterized SAM-binding protein YcdF (DUF218 family)